MKEESKAKEKNPEPQARHSPSSDPNDGGDDDNESDEDDNHEDKAHDQEEKELEDSIRYNVEGLKAELKEWIEWKVHNCLAAVKSYAVHWTHLAFAEASEEIKFSIFDKMDNKEKEAERNINNLAYA